MSEVYQQWLTIPGKPVPHVRMTQKSKHTNRQAQRYLAYKEQIGWFYTQKNRGHVPFTGPVSIKVGVYLANPNARKWDASNVLKAIEDGLNGIAYDDDKQIVRASIEVSESPDFDCVTVELEGEYT